MNRVLRYLALIGLCACHSQDNIISDSDMLTFDQSAQQIQTVCDDERERLVSTLDLVAKTPLAEATFENSVGAIEAAVTGLNNTMNPLTFLKYTATDAAIRATADLCETAVQKMFVDIFVRDDLYGLIVAAKEKKLPLDDNSAFLLEEYISSFQRNGLALPADARKEFIEKKKRLVTIEAQFAKNLIEWDDALAVEEAALSGLSEDYKRGLKKDSSGKYLITLDYPRFFPFMENSIDATARKKLEEKFFRRGGVKNRALLDEAIALRRKLAQMLGFKTHADFVLAKRMAKTPGEVSKFLSRLQERLIPKGRADLAELQALKDAATSGQEPLMSYDWRYYENELKKKKYQVDHEQIRRYFPLERVLSGLFETFETLLGVRFERADIASTWHSSVRTYRIARDSKTIAYFYMDLFPREGKYGHAAAFTLVAGHRKPGGDYQIPVSAIVANFTPPSDQSMVLLEHQEVETLFHEFGHIMHQVLTTAQFASYSGTSVKNDFVEAPSQMLENWVWDESSLTRLCGHYQTNEKMPKDLVAKLLQSKLANSGIRYLRQLSLALIDMTYHTADTVDATAVYERISQEVMLIPIPAQTYPQASFGHLMGGYDSGYYGYLWSEVYAQDLFSRFEREGLFNGNTGADYRRWILEPGGLKDPFVLIKGFLGREPSEDAFFRSLGLK